MRQTHEPSQEALIPAGVIVLLVALILAWPAVLLGLLVGWTIKRRELPALVWPLLLVLGLGGLWLIVTHLSYGSLFQAMTNAIPPFTRWNHLETWRTFLPFLFPLWVRSLLLLPLGSLLIFLVPQSMEQHLLSQEKRAQARRERASYRASRLVARVPDQIKGHAVLGVSIDDPQ